MNILVAGKHGALTDTMIFVSADAKKEMISMVSIPRDLYVDGRKINSVYHDYGMDELARRLSKILGRKIDQYILIDMYAFIDVVDLIGGVDVHLENAVIDPTYKTFDNGEWGTLAYEPGDHHLNGKQALRIARSRNFSSDFDRAARQQVILKAVKDKLKGLGLTDAAALGGIVKTVLARTETNVSFKEAISYYFRFKDYELRGGNVLSGANVLRASSYNVSVDASAEEREKCFKTVIKKEDGELCGKFEKAYVLLPKDNDWNLIKWYVDKVLAGK